MVRHSDVPLINPGLMARLSVLLGNSELHELLAQARSQLVDATRWLMESRQPEAIERVAHRIKGSLGSIGFDRLAWIAERVENKSKRDGSWTQDLQLFRQTLTDSLAAVDVVLAEQAVK